MRGQRRGHAGVDDDQVHAAGPRHDADGRTARQEVAHHLGGHRLGIAGDALRRHPVIGGRHDDRGALHGWPIGSEDARKL